MFKLTHDGEGKPYTVTILPSDPLYRKTRIDLDKLPVKYHRGAATRLGNVNKVIEKGMMP